VQWRGVVSRVNLESDPVIANLARSVSRPVICLLALGSGATTLRADSPQHAFVKAWQGRPVTVKATLYSVIYNERGRFGTSRSGLRQGVIVATPWQGTYFTFDARQGGVDVTRRDLHGFVAAVNAAYESNVLDVRPYRKVEAVAINSFDPGVELRVSDVRVERDQVWFEFATAGEVDAATGIRVKWPVPLSKLFSERNLVEALVQRFVEIKQP
jgi:hypothetical protein